MTPSYKAIMTAVFAGKLLKKKHYIPTIITLVLETLLKKEGWDASLPLVDA
jgi:hypothetical protein